MYDSKLGVISTITILQVPPEAGDERENHIQDYRIAEMDSPLFPVDERTKRQRTRDTHWLYTEAGKTEWDCCRIFANRSLEILLAREIPMECITVLEYEICPVRLDQYKYPTREIPSIDFANGIIGESCEPVGGANTGQTKFKYHGSERTFICKQSKCNVQRALLSEEEMRHRISTEFAAFSIYSTANHHIPDLNTHVPCCAKFEFRYRISAAKYSSIVEMDVEDDLNCLVMRDMDTVPLESKRLWMPKEVFEVMKFGRTEANYDHKCIVDWHGLAKYCGLTLEEFRKKYPECCDDNQKYRLIFHLPHAEVKSVCTGIVLDALLANPYGWGTYNKCRLSRERGTNRIIRMSTEQCLGNVEIEVLNYDGQQNVAKLTFGTLDLLMLSMSSPIYSNWKILVSEIREQCIRHLNLLKESLAAHPADYNEPFADLQLPADLTRQYQLYPDYFYYAKHPYPDKIWENYLAHRCDNLLNALHCKTDFPEALFFGTLLGCFADFAQGHGPFLNAFMPVHCRSKKRAIRGSSIFPASTAS
jgi:hypothetical protein